MKLPLPPLDIQVEVTHRVISATTLLALARHGDDPEPWKVLRSHTSVCGGGGGGLTYWCEGKGATDEQVNPSWLVPWARMVEICRAGMTPSTLMGLWLGMSRYQDLHRDPWCSHRPAYVPGGWEVNAVSDSLAYDEIWFPAFCAASRLMRQAEDELFTHALEVLSESEPVREQMALELSA